MAKKIMHALRISEISAVDRPAQAHAKVAIMKRAVRKDMYQVGSFANVLCSIGGLMQSAQYEAEREGDHSVVPAKLQGWLRSGAEIFRTMAAEEINEMLASINKRRDDDADEYWKRAFSAKEREHLASTGAAEPDGSYPISNASDLHNAMRAYGRSKNKAKTMAHIRARAKALGLEGELSEAFAKALAAGDAVDPNGDPQMDPDVLKALGLAADAKPADVVAAIAKMAEGFKAATSELAIAKAAMSDDEKEFHDGLKSDDEREKFRAMSRDERKERMKKRDDLSPVVAKALAENDELKKRLAVLEADKELLSFRKRAVDIGFTEAQGEMLMKAHHGDADALKKLESAIKGLNEQIATGKVFEEFGTAHGADGNAYGEITAKAEEVRKTNPKLSIAKARAMVIEDPANADLVKRYNAEQLAKRAA